MKKIFSRLHYRPLETDDLKGDPSKTGFRLIKASSIVFLTSILTVPFSYAMRVFFSRTLTIEDFGLFYAFMGVVGILSTFNDLGFGNSVAYYVPQFIRQKDYQSSWNAFKYNQFVEIGTSIVISLIVLIFKDVIAEQYFKIALAKDLIPWFCLFFISSSALSSLNRYFNGLQRPLFYSTVDLLRFALMVIISGVIMLVGYAHLHIYVIAWTLVTVVIMFLYQGMFRAFFSFLQHSLQWDKQLFIKMWRYAIPSFLSTSLGFLMVSVDTIMLTLLKGVGDVGINNIVLPLTTMSTLFLSPISLVLFPFVASLGNEHGEKVQWLIHQMLRFLPFLSVYFGLFIFVFPEAPIELIFGQKWVSLARLPLQFAALLYIIAPVDLYLSNVSTALGQVREKLNVSIAVMLLKVISGIIGIYYFGLIGLIISNALVHLLSIIFVSFYVKRLVPFTFPWKVYALLGVIAVMTFSIVRITSFQPIGWGEYLLTGVVYSAVMGLIFLLLKVVDKAFWKIIFDRFPIKVPAVVTAAMPW